MNLTRCVRRPFASIYGKMHFKALHISAYQLTSPSSLAEIKYRPYKDAVKVAATKKPKRDPFVPRFFLGKIDEDLFEYPELSSEHLQRVNDMTSVVQGYYDSSKNQSSELQSSKEISEELLSGLKSIGLFGQSVPKLYGGLELSAFEMNRMAEVVSQDPAIFHLINFHNLYAVHAILKGGTEAQKQLYLPKLASGESTFGICIWEKNCGSDLSSVETKAVPLDGDSYLVSGTKVWVNNIDGVDDLLVLVDVSVQGSRNYEKDLCFFLINKNSPGITVKKVEKTALEQLGTYEVTFDNTVVKSENMVGKRGSAFEVANEAIFPRMSVMPSAVVETLKSLFNKTVMHLLTREQFGQPLYNYNLIQWKLAEASIRLYVLESMTYLTAGLHDDYEDQNTVVECAITKIHALDTLEYCLKIFSELLSSRLLEKDFAPVDVFKDSEFFKVSEGTKDVIKLHITLHCLRFLGEYTHEHIAKLRNPMFYPAEKFKDILLSIQQSKDCPALTHVISENVHPALKTAADTLEYCILRLQWVVDLNIVHSGAEITENQHVMAGLADILSLCYAMSAAIARASRSYCIGLKNAEYEIMAAHTYTTENVAKIRQLVEMLDPHHPPVFQDTITNIAEANGANKGYFAEHPTQRTYL